MQLALHLTTKILPGNKIEIEIPEGEIGDTVDIFVVLPEKPKEKSGYVPAPICEAVSFRTKGALGSAPSKRSVMEILEEVHAKRPPRSAEDIDRQIADERDSWDS